VSGDFDWSDRRYRFKLKRPILPVNRHSDHMIEIGPVVDRFERVD